MRWRNEKAIESRNTWFCFVSSLSRSLYQQSWPVTSDLRVSRRIFLMRPVWKCCIHILQRLKALYILFRYCWEEVCQQRAISKFYKCNRFEKWIKNGQRIGSPAFSERNRFYILEKYLNKKIYTIIFSLVCVHNCTNHDDGDYQSCNTCNGYVSCGGHVLSNRDCPSTLVWDSLKGRCEYNSSTCDPQHLPKLKWTF